MRVISTCSAAVLAVCLAGGVQAATFNITDGSPYSGNGCTGGGPNADDIPKLDQGSIGGGSSCSYDESDAIVKYGFGNDGSISSVDLNSAYSSIFDADWITFTFDDLSNSSGTWSYDPEGATATGITAAYFKGGNFDSINVYEVGDVSAYFGGSDAFTWATGGGSGLSNAVFFNTDGGTPPPNGVIPLPAGIFLLGGALAGLVGLRRRKRA